MKGPICNCFEVCLQHQIGYEVIVLKIFSSTKFYISVNAAGVCNCNIGLVMHQFYTTWHNFYWRQALIYHPK